MGYGHWDDTAYRAAESYRASRGIDDFGYTAALRDAPYGELDGASVARSAGRDAGMPGLGRTRQRAAGRRALRRHRLDGAACRGSCSTISASCTDCCRKGTPTTRRSSSAPSATRPRPGSAADRPVRVGQPDGPAIWRASCSKAAAADRRPRVYELAMYFMARHIATDAWEKRGKRGYLFIIGDEMPKPRWSPREIRAGHRRRCAAADVAVESIYRELAERWHIFYILPTAAPLLRRSARSPRTGATCSARTS